LNFDDRHLDTMNEPIEKIEMNFDDRHLEGMATLRGKARRREKDAGCVASTVQAQCKRRFAQMQTRLCV